MHAGNPETGTLRSRLAPAQVDLLLIYVLRCGGIFSEAVINLDGELFRADSEAAHRTLWSACRNYYRQYQQQPSPTALASDAAALIDGLLDEMGMFGPGRPVVYQQIQHEQQQLLDLAAAPTDEELHEPHGLDLLRQFLEERSLYDSLRQELVSAPDGAVPANVGSLLGRYLERSTQVTCSNAKVTGGIFDGDVDTFTASRVPVGIPFLDRYLMGPPDIHNRATPGGHCGGECYAVMGAFGSGKTTLTTMLCGETINRFEDLYGLEGARQRYAAMVTYELSPDVLRRQLVSHMARVPRGRLLGGWQEVMERLSRSADPDTLTDYDRRQCNGVGEYDRLEQNRHLLQAWQFFDFRGATHAPMAGRGYLQEVQAEIEKVKARTGRIPGIVVIDYASLCVRRHIMAGLGPRGADVDKVTKQLLTWFCDTARRLIASRYGCPVWVMHQLSGASNSRAPSARLTIADGAGDKSFGENFDGVFLIHRQDRETGCSMLTCEKARYSPPDGNSTLIRFDKDLARLLPAEEEFTLDLTSRRIQPRNLLNAFASPREIATGTRPGSVGSTRNNRPADDLGMFSDS